MKKRIATCLILLILMAPIAVVAANEVHVAVDGVLVTFDGPRPIEFNGHVLAPVRAVFERMDFYVDRDVIEGREIVILQRHDFTIQITVGELSFSTNGVVHALPTAAQNIDGSIKLPIRALVESMGMTVVWDEISRILIITSPPQQAQTPINPTFTPTLPPGVPIEFMPTAPPAGVHHGPPGVTPPAVTPPGNIVVAPPVPQVPAVIHTVQPAENLARIARNHFPELDHDDNRIHTQAVDQIVRDNPIITNRHLIQVGWQLRIYPFGTVPAPIPTPVDIALLEAAREFPHLPVQHRIVPNENLDIIARRHFPTLDMDDLDLRLSVIAQIARDNDIANPHHIVAGTYITINPFVRP